MQGKISAIIVKLGEDEYSLWEEIGLTKEEEATIKEILNRHETDGGSTIINKVELDALKGC